MQRKAKDRETEHTRKPLKSAGSLQPLFERKERKVERESGGEHHYVIGSDTMRKHLGLPLEGRLTARALLSPLSQAVAVMNAEQERPFVCSAPGCSQRFPTEDHLMIHRHKHEMTLKFPSIKNDNMLSDQTPTPTRFLKNCEEVGLFSELDCSIEQEFCKAQEEEDSKQPHSRMTNHDSSIVIQQALPSPQSSSVITQA
ncbi:hypothetical protein JZ751_009697, partial [Albula glossodonta]